MLLKDLYSPGFYNRFTHVMEELLPAFDRQEFLNRIFTEEFQAMELKERMRHTTHVLGGFFPADFSDSVMLIRSIIQKLKALGFRGESIEFMFLPDFIEVYGINHPDESIQAFEFITQFISCEFAIRPFLIKYEEETLRRMKIWSLHTNHHVRRFASEGTRPRLPWAMAVPRLKKEPALILEILDNLKNDPSEYVRRSVANSLNDVSKDHPTTVLQLAQKWKGKSQETDALLKHACRTLLKQGNPTVLSLYGLDSNNLILDNFKILTPSVKMGGDLQFSFSVANQGERQQTVRIEYILYFKRRKNQFSKTVFKVSERVLKSGEQITIVRKHSFKPITTRRYYGGEQRLSVVINGRESSVAKIELEESTTSRL
ncbi:DNA alkylation repair protein [Pedobacter sp. SYSU D00535]|uniref:DNA alkylation repair protein n=1 Tax=Pedobacter sp. SYSU D00535 TaxID=2810308 RepID=UPI001A96EB86|nr:DNA alkylation repair protein [Pedobacter sp. SYSU D00535]